MALRVTVPGADMVFCTEAFLMPRDEQILLAGWTSTSTRGEVCTVQCLLSLFVLLGCCFSADASARRASQWVKDKHP